jgi:hypothetical protein
MLIWRGWGLIPLILFAIINFLIQWAADSWIGPTEGLKHFSDDHSWVYFLSLTISAIACWLAGTALDKDVLKNAKIVIDKETVQEIRLISANDLFWIPVKWWSVIFVVIGFYMLLSSSIE